MELVLSPGRLGGGGNSTGSPFQNEEVREWSHVDRLTGMLEHARVETGRWQTRDQGTAQAYGKVIDSRERNSADGNVVQKARRQVEVFQSQGIGGRSVQVVRASQWSSSRITDSTSSSPVSVSMTDASQLRNGVDESLQLAKLSQVSRLCRQINGETAIASNNNKRTNYRERIGSQSPVIGGVVNRLKKFENGFREDGRLGSSLIGNGTGVAKSTSNEDLTKSVDHGANLHTIFTRDCKARRSLQIPKSGIAYLERNRTNENRRLSPEGTESDARNGCGSSASSDRDTTVVNKDRKKVKSYVLGMEEARPDSAMSSLCPPKNITDKKILFNGFAAKTGVKENGNDAGIAKNEYLRPTPILLKPKSATAVLNKSNTTVVHLNNKLFAESKTSSGSENESISSHDNDNTAIIRPVTKTVSKSRVQSLANQFSQSNNIRSSSIINTKISSTVNNHGSNSLIVKKQSIIDPSSRIESPTNNSVEILPSDGRPVKKVGFCKTEVHFAAESGKVNIVETDCKPPPSNRFRRRRRISNAVLTNPTAPSSGLQSNKNLPLIHFGDTSYEKYIFGQSNGDFNAKNVKPASESGASEATDLSVISEEKNEVHQRLQNAAAGEEFTFRDGWGSRIKTILQSEPLPISREIGEQNDLLNGMNNFDGVIPDETIAVDHTFKGSHTTTVNLGADVISKLQKHTNEGKCNTISTGIQLQFKTRLRKVTPIHSSPEIKPENESPAKNTVAVTKDPAPCSVVVSTVSKIPRPLIQTQQSVLRSAHLVMNLNRINILNSTAENTLEICNSFSKNCHTEKIEANPLTLKHILSSLQENSADDKYRGKTMSTLIKINEKNCSRTSCKSRISNGKTYPALFTPLQLKHLNDRLTQCQERRKIEGLNDSKEHYQPQYSSGSEQADEEVRSYMLGSKDRRKSNEERAGSKTVKETRDNDDSIDNTVNNHSIDDELDIANSGLPEEEVCFESNGTVKKNHVQEKLTNENNVVTSDNENNKVLFNIVTTHEPVIARVEDSRSPEARREIFGGKKSRSNPRTRLEEEDEYLREKSASLLTAKKTSIKQKAKDHCDNKSGKETMSGSNDDTEPSGPTYVNVFEGSGKKESVPIYENCCVTRKNDTDDNKYRKSNHIGKVVKSLAELNSITDAIVVKSTTNGDRDSDASSLSNTDCEEDDFKQSYSKRRDPDSKLATISENNLSKRNNRESQKLKPSKSRSKKIVLRSPSSTSSIESIHRNSANESARDLENKPLHAKSTRSSRLHRVTNGHESSGKETVERYIDKRKSTNERTSRMSAKSRSNQTVDPSTGTGTTNDQTKKSFNGSTRSKKPIEIVYETAVFNMKNEKLAKSSRSKDSKAPRYINDLICGSKPKRSTDAKHVKGAALSQQRVNQKSASPTNRHWK